MDTSLHIMVDIETTSRAHNAGLLSIGAIIFHPGIEDTNATMEREWRINAESNLDFGRDISQETLDWWKAQGEDARKIAFSGTTPLVTALEQFYSFCGKAGKIWACDPDFDCNILESACKAVELPFPFTFYQRLSVRTIKWLAYPDGGAPTIEGTAHSAIDDARHQVKLVWDCFSKLKTL